MTICADTGIGYDRSGPYGGTTVVLLHAGVADRRMWEPQWTGADRGGTTWCAWTCGASAGPSLRPEEPVRAPRGRRPDPVLARCRPGTSRRLLVGCRRRGRGGPGSPAAGGVAAAGHARRLPDRRDDARAAALRRCGERGHAAAATWTRRSRPTSTGGSTARTAGADDVSGAEIRAARGGRCSAGPSSSPSDWPDDVWEAEVELAPAGCPTGSGRSTVPTLVHHRRAWTSTAIRHRGGGCLLAGIPGVRGVGVAGHRRTCPRSSAPTTSWRWSTGGSLTSGDPPCADPVLGERLAAACLSPEGHPGGIIER